MKIKKTIIANLIVIALLISSFFACDKEYTNIGADIAGSNNFSTGSKDFSVIAYTKKIDTVQTNNLPINLLGVYKDPLYGLSTASFITQLTPATLDPDFGENVVLDSVVLHIPYFSTAISTDSDGNSVYELDSIFGEAPFKLEIFESDYFLRDFDPSTSTSTSQNYYSNASTSSTDVINTTSFQSLHIEDSIIPSANTIKIDNNGEIVNLSPALRILFDKTYWEEKIINQENTSQLSNINNFQDYFKGLYFKATDINGDGNMMLLNFGNTAAGITLYYTKDSTTEGEDRTTDTFVLNFGSINANFFSDNSSNLTYTDGNSITGDEKLYLKGGNGSMAIINLFGGDENGVSTELDKLKANNWLINEANLVFYTDQTQNSDYEPERVLLYDMNNHIPLVDYFLDAENQIPHFSRINHLGILKRENSNPEGKGVKYKIRLTEHINNLLLKDSTNVKLGLVVSGNVNLENQFSQFDILTTDDLPSKIPVSSIISPRGTVVYGNNTTDETKKLYLELFYTDLNE